MAVLAKNHDESEIDLINICRDLLLLVPQELK
jgi:hypothetical protein